LWLALVRLFLVSLRPLLSLSELDSFGFSRLDDRCFLFQLDLSIGGFRSMFTLIGIELDDERSSCSSSLSSFCLVLSVDEPDLDESESDVSIFFFFLSFGSLLVLGLSTSLTCSLLFEFLDDLSEWLSESESELKLDLIFIGGLASASLAADTLIGFFFSAVYDSENEGDVEFERDKDLFITSMLFLLADFFFSFDEDFSVEEEFFRLRGREK
jgi:hypothetical protein